MKILLSIVFLLTILGQSWAQESFDDNTTSFLTLIPGEVLQNSVDNDSCFWDKQDWNEWNGSDLFFDNSEIFMHLMTGKFRFFVLKQYGSFKNLLRYSLIDLPPPAIS